MVTVYALHAGKDYEVRKPLFDSVAKAWTQYGSHNCTIALGDFNARLGEKATWRGKCNGEVCY